MEESKREELRHRVRMWLESPDSLTYFAHFYQDLADDPEEVVRAFRRLAKTGRVEMAYVWMANGSFTSGEASAGAALLVAAGDGTLASEERVRSTYERMGSGDFRMVGAQVQSQVERLLADEDFRLFRVRPLPAAFTPEGPVYLFDAILTADAPRDHDGDLVPLVPCLVDPSAKAPLMPIPHPLLDGEVPLIPETEFVSGSIASDPGQIPLNPERLLALSPDLRKAKARDREAFASFIREQLQRGDSRAAYVVSVQPLLVAAYTDEFDCVVLLQFPPRLVSAYRLERGSRLLTVNLYLGSDQQMAEDLEPGPGNYGRYTNFSPIIAEFLSDDFTRINARKEEIEEAEWQRCWELGERARLTHPDRWRSGDPLLSMHPGSNAQGREVAEAGRGVLGCFGGIFTAIGKAVALVLVLSALAKLSGYWLHGNESFEIDEAVESPVSNPLGLDLQLPSPDFKLFADVSGNNDDALAIASLVRKELVMVREARFPAWLSTLAVSAHRSGGEGMIVVESQSVLDAEFIEAIWAAAKRVTHVPRGGTMQSLAWHGAILDASGFRGAKRWGVGTVDSPEIDLGSEAIGKFETVFQSHQGALREDALKDADRQWVLNWQPVILKADGDPLVYPALPEAPWYSWCTTEGAWERLKFCGLAIQNGVEILVYAPEPGEFSGLPLHHLRPASQAQAKALAASANGVLDPSQREPALPTAEIHGAEIILPNLIDKRSERDWTSPNPAGRDLRGTLVALGTERGQPVLFVLEADGRTVPLPLATLNEEDRTYLEAIQSGTQP